MGTLPDGMKYQRFATIKNTGDAPLIIQNVKSSWGGAVMSWPKMPIAPGSSERLRYQINVSKHMRGKQRKAFTIASNAENAPHYVLRYGFEVQEGVAVGPQLTFENEVYDYGTVEQHSNKRTATFRYKNTGSETLVLSRVKVSCGCMNAKYSLEPVLPGEYGTITVDYDTKRVGPFNKSITITSNDPERPTMMLRLKGKVNAVPDGAPTKATAGPRNN